MGHEAHSIQFPHHRLGKGVSEHLVFLFFEAEIIVSLELKLIMSVPKPRYHRMSGLWSVIESEMDRFRGAHVAHGARSYNC